MEFHGPIVRPYTDADSLFIEVTTGCTHNSCTFCNFYKDTPFRVAPIEQVGKDLQEASREVPFATRIWASGGNPFCLSTRRLIQLGDLFKKYFPKARVSTYARIDDLFHKSAEDIREIREHGIDDVLIGIESGDDDVLKAVNKGYTAEDVIRECQKIGQAGLPFRIIYLGGLAGAGRLEESARKSAAVFNQIHPYYMYLTNVAVLPGTKLYGQMMRGEFAEATEKERLQEIRTLLAEMRNPIVVDTESAASSIYLKVKLPEEKASVLRELDAFIARFSPEQEKLLHARRARMLSV